MSKYLFNYSFIVITALRLASSSSSSSSGRPDCQHILYISEDTSNAKHYWCFLRLYHQCFHSYRVPDLVSAHEMHALNYRPWMLVKVNKERAFPLLGGLWSAHIWAPQKSLPRGLTALIYSPDFHRRGPEKQFIAVVVAL